LAAARWSQYREFLAEEYVPGMDLSVAVLVRGGDVIALDPLEITTPREFYDYDAKHDPGARKYFCPARLPATEVVRARGLAARVCRAIGVEGAARVDMVASDVRLVVLEVNTLPGLSESGNLAAMAAAAGIRYDDCILGILGSALPTRGTPGLASLPFSS
jgi:D-alanine-D-alanine ligase